MNSKTMTKALAAFLAFILSFANVALLGNYRSSTYASGIDLEEQTTNVKNTEVEFDAYFQAEGKTVHSKAIDVEGEEKLTLSLKVKEGYLSNGSIKIENANFKVQELGEELKEIQSISSNENRIILNQINRDESVILEIPIKMNTDSKFEVQALSKTASITLEGTYVNNKGKEVQINKTIEAETSIDGTANSSLTEEILKYVTFNVNGNRGVILQTLIKSNIVDNKLPAKTTKLEIEIPMINNNKPESITLSAKSLMATKGLGTKIFTEENYKYEDGKVTLIIENDSEMLSWEKNTSDEIILTCIYNENSIASKVNLELKANSEITYYGKELKTVQAYVDEKLELTEKIGDIATLDINTSTNNIYKGYMLEKNGKNTEFVDDLNLNIGYSELMDKMILKDETSYLDQNGNLYPANILYKYSKISEENFRDILGEDGYVKIYSKSGEIITTLNKENLEYTFEDGIYGITFETSKPIQEGILKIENGRAIRPLEYSREQEETFTSLRVNFVTNISKDNVVIIRGNESKDIKLENPTSQATLSISNPNISTVVKNEGVELRVTLKTTDANTALYKNPEVSIVLPNYITNVEIENVKLVYEKELKLSSAKMYKNENGNIVINIKLEGEQTSYNEDLVTEGSTLIMKADIKTNSLTPTNTKQAELHIKNEKTNEDIVSLSDLKFVAPAGIATISQITGHSDTNETVTSISGEMGVGEIKSNSPAKEANVRMVAINNYEYDCDNVVILGRTTFEGNKKITSGDELGSTFTADVVSGIKSENGLNDDQMKVYYSENKEATKNLSDDANGWTSNIDEVENVNSYMVMLDNYTFKSRRCSRIRLFCRNT